MKLTDVPCPLCGAGMVSTYNGGPDAAKGRVGPGHLAPKVTREGCCVHVAREFARERAA